MRWVRDDSGQVAPDLARSAFGRGAWLHATPGCIAKLSSALSRSFRAPVVTTPEQGLLLLGAAAFLGRLRYGGRQSAEPHAET